MIDNVYIVDRAMIDCIIYSYSRLYIVMDLLHEHCMNNVQTALLLPLRSIIITPSTPLCEEIRAIVSSISATVDGSTVSGPALITTVYEWMRRRGMVMAMAVLLSASHRCNN